MKQQVVYIHGGESFMQYDLFLNRLQSKQIWDLPSSVLKTKWTNRLASDLGEAYEVFLPEMPNKQNAKYAEWSIWFERHFEHFHDGMILIGCSLGAMFLLKYLSENNLPFTVKAMFVMASPVQMEGFKDSDCGDFFYDVKNSSHVQDVVENLFIVHSKDDFLVPFDHALKLHEFLPNSQLLTFEDKNHFLIPEFPELIAEIKKL